MIISLDIALLLHCVWYRRIREERNWGERDRREIAHFFSLADKRNKRERELKHMGPTHFRLSTKLRRNSRERFVSNFILIANYKKEKKHIK
jgi:DNA primase catalytic subunit